LCCDGTVYSANGTPTDPLATVFVQISNFDSGGQTWCGDSNVDLDGDYACDYEGGCVYYGNDGLNADAVPPCQTFNDVFDIAFTQEGIRFVARANGLYAIYYPELVDAPYFPMEPFVNSFMNFLCGSQDELSGYAEGEWVTATGEGTGLFFSFDWLLFV